MLGHICEIQRRLMCKDLESEPFVGVIYKNTYLIDIFV